MVRSYVPHLIWLHISARVDRELKDVGPEADGTAEIEHLLAGVIPCIADTSSRGIALKI